MIRNTFCHIPGIGEKFERRLWDAGAVSWFDSSSNVPGFLSRKKREMMLHYCHESSAQLAAGNAGFFADLLPSSQTWRMFPDFENHVAFLDIETTGLNSDADYVTTIALYDGLNVYTFVKGDNLDEFAGVIERFKLLVTYNGKGFDVPFLRRHMGIPLEQAHIDLRHVLAGLGYRGGLKSCEHQLGMSRHELEDIDGYFAVLLWNDFQRTCNRKSLETLLAYNIADVLNLAEIMPRAYNMKLAGTPFSGELQLPPAAPSRNPFSADMETVERIRRLLPSTAGMFSAP